MSTYEILVEKGRMEERARLEPLLEAERVKAKSELARAEAEKVESAIKMLQSNFDVQMVANILNMPVEQVEKLR